ncbi:MAG: hypothetical protein KAW17_09735 [Candidatus Eisenbacteria sp.]|nr:hypothetical protein [Candidatus Eisenbacteria bacterium]
MATDQDGRTLYVPQAKAKVDTSRAAGAPMVLGNVVALLGECSSGEPQVVHEYGSLSALTKVHRSGNIVDAAVLAFGPSTRTGGAEKVKVVRVETATKATGDMTSSGGITLTANDWGTLYNDLEWKVETGGTSGKKVTFLLYEDLLSQDNLGDVLDIQYTGVGATAVLDVDADDPVVGFKCVVAGTGSGFQFDLTTTQYNTIGKLFAALAALDDYTVTLNPNAHPGMTAISTAYLTDVAAQDVKASAYSVLATPYIVMDWINHHVPWVTATMKSITVPANTTGYESWTTNGGSIGTAPAATPTNYESALILLQDEAAHLLWVGSELAAVHAMLKTHCHLKEDRIGFVGGSLAQTKAQAQSAAAVLNSDRIVQAYPGVGRYGADATVTTISSLFSAALLAGLMAGLPLYEPGTHKYVDVASLEADLSMADRETLQLSGVACLCKSVSKITGNMRGFWVSKLNTAIQENMGIWNTDGTTPEVSLRRLSDAVRISMEDWAETEFVGRSSRYLSANLKGRAQSRLDDFRGAGWITDIVDPDTGTITPGWRNVTVRQEADAWYLDFEINMTTPANFVFITAHVLPPRTGLP